jgi:acyl dehydratase
VVTLNLTQEQFNRFADLSGDDNPIHVDPDFSARTRFGRTAAHGMFLYSLLTGLSGRFQPGAVHLQAKLTFRAPTYAAEPVRFSLQRGEDSTAGLLLAQVRVLSSSPEPGLEGTLVLLPPPFTPESWQSAAADLLAPAAPPADSAAEYKSLRLGKRAGVARTFTFADLHEYTQLANDPNPLYTDPDYVRSLGLADAPVPGPLLGGLFSYLLGTRLPGRGTNWLKQRLDFLRPAYPGEALTARVEITRLRPEKDLVNLHTWCENESGQVVCTGEALVLAADLEV